MDYHDVLALFGAGSAHPGGYRGTLAWLAGLDLQPDARVLEIGCGTGRTACEVAKRFGAEVIGCDLRKTMVEKARIRAKEMGCNATFVHVDDTLPLPFAAGSFDLLVAESVSIFNEIAPLLEEYHRVLRPGAKVVDTEMAAAFPLPQNVLEEARALYGAKEVPTLKEWKGRFQKAGFVDVRILHSGPVQSQASDFEQLDTAAVASPEAYSAAAAAIVEHNHRFMAMNWKWFTYGVFLARKD